VESILVPQWYRNSPRKLIEARLCIAVGDAGVISYYAAFQYVRGRGYRISFRKKQVQFI